VGGAARRLLLVIGAAILALTGVLAPARAPVARAASGGLVLTSAATYTLVPASRLVRVTLDLTARNDKPNVTAGGIVTKYFYEGARVAIQAEATAVRATSGGARLTVTTTPADGYRVLEMRFRSAIFYGQTAKVRVTFDLPGGRPRSASDIRVGTAFATFVAWAFGDSGSVRVVVPAGFEAETTGSTVTRSASNGATIFRATGITDIGAWYLVVNADRQSALTNDRVDLSGGEHVVIRAWPEDAEWRKRVRGLITTGLPELVRQTGLDWPVADDLTVFEVHTPLLEGYAGVFFVNEDRIEISEDLDDLTILHEASHAWFNRGLFDGRWINEGLADTYAALALDEVASGGWAPAPVSPTDKAAVRLVDWVHPGRITDDATEARERYGYDAAWTVVRSLVLEIGDAKMRDVLRAAQDHRTPYAGAGAPETVTGPADWRRFLDLLEEVGGSTAADETFRRWVVTDAQSDVLAERAAARTAYAALVTAGSGWQVPAYVRGRLADWDFAAATARIAEASALLARRDALVTQAATLGVQPPAELRTAYESAGESLEAATRIADRDEAAARALATAIEAVAAPRAPFVTLGLLGTTPEADLADARAAFGAGLADAAARAAAVSALIDGSVEIGRGRLLAAIGLLAVLVVLLVLAVLVVLRRRRGRRLALAALAVESGAAAEAGDATAVVASEADDAPEPAPDAGPASAVDPAPAAAEPPSAAEPPPVADTAPAPDPAEPAEPPPYVTLADQSDRPPDGEPTGIDDPLVDPTDGTRPRRRRSRRRT
jgi:hypothetical protein